MRRLNFGCGSVQPDGWDNYDRSWRSRSMGPITIPKAATYDYIVAHHVIQQWTHHTLVVELGRLRSLLKPGGVLRVSVPDVVAGFEAFLRNDAGWFPIPPDDISISELFSRWLTWYGENSICFTPGYLEEALRAAGFVLVDAHARCGYSIYGDFFSGLCDLDTRCDESIYMDAVTA